MHYFLAQKNNLKFHKKLHCAKLPPVFWGGTLGIRVFQANFKLSLQQNFPPFPAHLPFTPCPSPLFWIPVLRRVSAGEPRRTMLFRRKNSSDLCSAGDGRDEGALGSRLGWTVSAPQLQPSAACLPHGTRASQNTITGTTVHVSERI